MKKFIAGVIVGIILVPVTAYLYFLSGRAPVATSAPTMPFEKFFASTALHAKLAKDMPTSVPIEANETTFALGAMTYTDNCSVCHGLINRPETAIAKGMFPHPPQLLEPGQMVADDPPGETFWKVKNGIRLTGMPGFHASLSDKEIWQVSLLLANADKLPDSVKQILTFTPPGSAPSGNGSTARPASTPKKK